MDRRDTGKVGCQKGEMQDWRDAGKEGCKNGGMQERRGAGKERFRKGRMQERKVQKRTDARKDGVQEKTSFCVVIVLYNSHKQLPSFLQYLKIEDGSYAKIYCKICF